MLRSCPRTALIIGQLINKATKNAIQYSNNKAIIDSKNYGKLVVKLDDTYTLKLIACKGFNISYDRLILNDMNIIPHNKPPYGIKGYHVIMNHPTLRIKEREKIYNTCFPRDYKHNNITSFIERYLSTKEATDIALQYIPRLFEYCVTSALVW